MAPVPDAVLDEPGGGLLATFDDSGAAGLAALLFTLDVGVLAAGPSPVCAAEELGALLVLIGLSNCRADPPLSIWGSSPALIEEIRSMDKRVKDASS